MMIVGRRFPSFLSWPCFFILVRLQTEEDGDVSYLTDEHDLLFRAVCVARQLALVMIWGKYIFFISFSDVIKAVFWQSVILSSSSWPRATPVSSNHDDRFRITSSY
jgi:hypothetical protein